MHLLAAVGVVAVVNLVGIHVAQLPMLAVVVADTLPNLNPLLIVVAESWDCRLVGPLGDLPASQMVAVVLVAHYFSSPAARVASPQRYRVSPHSCCPSLSHSPP